MAGSKSLIPKYEEFLLVEQSLGVLKLSDDAILPCYAHPDDACMDIRSIVDYIISPFNTAKIKTGLAFEIPHGYELMVRPRSGLSGKGIQVILGTVDETYKGEVCVIMYNSTDNFFHVSKGDRVAQLSLQPVTRVKCYEVHKLSETERGIHGFGSSGLQ